MAFLTTQIEEESEQQQKQLPQPQHEQLQSNKLISNKTLGIVFVILTALTLATAITVSVPTFGIGLITWSLIATIGIPTVAGAIALVT